MRINTLLYLTAIIFNVSAYGQSVTHESDWNPDTAYENIHVMPVQHTEEASSYMIFVKDIVPPHRHNEHTEHVYVIEGAGIMLFNDEYINIKQGDVIAIPPKTVHAVKTTSADPLKVLSVQAPRFEGSDRESVKTDKWPPTAGRR